MKNLIPLLSICPMLSFAQVVHEVEAFGGGLGNPNPQYDPQFITINVGDTVRWTNTQGKHNVYGENDDFPNNPVPFSSGNPEFAPWTYEFAFEVAGFYGYHCTQQDHSQTQFGTITVMDPNSVPELDNSQVRYDVYPNPASDVAHYSFEGADVLRLELLDNNGKLLKTISDQNSSGDLQVHDLKQGQYLLRVYTKDGRSFPAPLFVQ